MRQPDPGDGTTAGPDRIDRAGRRLSQGTRFLNPSPLRISRARFTIGRLMVAVAVAGVLAAILRMASADVLMLAAVFTLVPASIAFFWPFLFAGPGRRLVVAAWVASLWPLSIPCSLNVAWAVARAFLGHAPGPIDKHPVLAAMSWSVGFFFLFSLFSTVVCLGLLIPATDERDEGRSRWAARAWPLTLGMPAVWFSVVMILAWDPLDAGHWFMD